ncbi:MAG TPA: hypothetical protein VGM05_32810 [Planctomycetaceae bacterium]|jgi:hypothetical protein
MNCVRGFLTIALSIAPNLLCAAETAIEDRPYDVRVRISFEGAVELDAPFRADILELTAAGLERCLGPFWHCEVVEEQGRVFSGTKALSRLAPEGLVRNSAIEETDKSYLIAVASTGAGIICDGREWDVATRQLGPRATKSVLDRRDLPAALLSLIHELFRPVAEIDQPRSGRTTLRGRGANLSPADSSWPALPSEKLFEAYNCILDKDLAVERIQQIPWTYLNSVNDVEAGRVHCTVTSGLRSPLAGRRHRLLTLALGINDRGPETKLTLVTRGPARKPLAGVEVELAAMLPSKPQSDEAAHDVPAKTLPTLITDRNGKVSLPAECASADRPIWLLVRSGQVLLARVPYLPGLHPAEVIELPDDSLRLEVEADIALLQAKLVDTVARRAVLMAQAKARAKAGQFDAAATALRALDAMSKAPKFTEDLNLIRINRTKAARARRDKSTEERIRKLCSETGELVTNYLDEAKLTELRDEIRELRRATDDAAAMEAKAKAADERAAKGAKPKSKPATKPAEKADAAAAGREPASDEKTPGVKTDDVRTKAQPR